MFVLLLRNVHLQEFIVNVENSEGKVLFPERVLVYSNYRAGY
jgi:hypothetical protein